MNEWADDIRQEEQAGFRKGYSTADQIFNLQSIVQKYITRDKGRCYIMFVDFATAFDRIPHSHLFYKLIKSGIHGKILNILRSMYGKLKTCLRTPEGLTEFFVCLLGTRQGCMLSPFLFALYIEELIEMLKSAGCRGIYIDEFAENVMALLFADDVAICSETVGRLREMIKVLENFSNKWGLKVNLDKTKIMVFRRGGKIKADEVFYFENNKIEIVNRYKYLGMFFTPCLKWTLATSTLAQQATRALTMIHVYDRKCGNLNFDIAMDIFDKTIIPILTYGSEIWGCKFHNVIERVQTKFIRKQLGVGSSTSGIAVLGDSGRRPIAIIYHLRCFKFWLKLKNMSDERYPKRCYLMLKVHDSNGRKNWVTDVKDMLQRFGCGHFWDDQDKILPDENEKYILQFQEAMIDYYDKQWWSDLRNSSKLSIYASFKRTFGKEKYLDTLTLKKFIKSLAQFRTSNHNLEIEIGRHKGLRMEERICVYCEKQNIIVIEDEYHLLLCCPMYTELRQKYPSISGREINFKSFMAVMSDLDEEHIVELAMFLNECFQTKKVFADVSI